MTSLRVSKLMITVMLLQYPRYSVGFGWWFLWQMTGVLTALQTSTTTTTYTSVSASPFISQSANGLEISLGNRENTTSIGTDGGTNISNVEVNYARELPLKYDHLFSTLQEKAVSEIRTISAGTFSPEVWIETILEAYYSAANESQRDTLSPLSKRLIDLEAYAEDVAAMLDRIRIAFGIELNQRLLTLDVTVLRCTQGQAVDALAKKVFQGNSECIEDRLERVRNAQQEAAVNMSRMLVEWDEVYLRTEIARCLEDETDTIWSGNDYQLACISKILHEVHRKTLLMPHTAQQLTMEANSEFGTAKADMLQCAGDLVDQAKESLDDISVIISECQKRISDQQNKLDVNQPTDRS
uniref:Uncharacterized protein n=1 Tax=Anopheles minimus TaxID=112268 RepID=A0A1Y9IV72_9DIPT